MNTRMVLVVAALFTLVVLGVKECGEWLDETAMAAVEPDPSTLKPCVGRKPVREHGRKYIWYCGSGRDEAADRAGARLAAVDAVATKGRTTVGAACGRTSVARGR
jgi:hypothetical protein